MGLRAQEIGVEMANTLSQIKLNESQANKNEAEADKIKGVDTKAQQATIDNLIAQTSNETWPIGQKTKLMKHAGTSKAYKKESIN